MDMNYYHRITYQIMVILDFFHRTKYNFLSLFLISKSQRPVRDFHCTSDCMIVARFWRLGRTQVTKLEK